MPRSYVNKNEDSQGDYEVHTNDCPWLSNIENRIYLGVFSNCEQTVNKAKDYYSRANGHKYCAENCHTS